MGYLHSFLQEATQELLYNIVYDVCKDNGNGGIEFRELSEKFKAEFGNQPMDFFGHHNEQGWIRFLKLSPGIHFMEGTVIISEEKIGKCVAYKKFNETKVHLTHESFNITVAKYRQILIHKACELVSGQIDAVGIDVVDAHGNTPLHLIASLPCIGHEPTLVEHLLDAGFDPLKMNNTGQCLLHIITCRMQAEVSKDEDENVDIDCGTFGNSKFDPSRWPANDRTALLKLLSSKLSDQELTVLANTPNKSGNTAMHEWVISLSTISSRGLQLGFDQAEKEIGLKLLSFGANLRQQNNAGEIPLHFAYNSEIFQFLLEHSTQKTVVCCRARNERDETPLLRIVKYATHLASNSTGEENLTAMLILQQLITLVTSNEEICKTAWIPDVDGNSAVDIILTAIRNTSHSTSKPATIFANFSALFGSSSYEKNGKFRAFREHSITLLERSLRVANEHDVKRRNLLHLLLDLGDITDKNIDDTELLQSVELLLKSNAEVNAMDSKGCTPLDVVKEFKSKMPSSSFFTKCEEKLLHHGAKSGSSFLTGDQETSGPNVDNKVRKILSCPKKHLNCAQLLIKNNDQVTVIKGKYRYSSQDPIGLGAFSSIFVTVKDENEDAKFRTINCRAYALKRMEKAKINRNEFKRETTTLLSISNKCDNIIKYHEFLEDDNFLYLCLDLMDGDLNEFVTNNDVSKDLEDPVIHVQVTKQIINGLAYLHEQKFVHRDLKPENILYTTDPDLNFKIADFGLTKNLSSTVSTMTSTKGSGVAMAPGTRCWMAPELISMKSREHTTHSDIFSLGLVLHYLLTWGKHPFATGREEPAHVIESKIVDSKIQIHQALHPEAIRFLQILLHKDPSKRLSAKVLDKRPFLWSERKKIEFLKAVGDQREAANPTKYPNSPLEQYLQETDIGKNVYVWNVVNPQMKALFAEMKQIKYRTDKVIDLLRFIRNAYAHQQERTPLAQGYLDSNVFLQTYPSLVLDVFAVIENLGFLTDASRSNIQRALTA